MKKITSIALLVFSVKVGFAQLYIAEGAEIRSVGTSLYSNENVMNEGSIIFEGEADFILDAGLDNSAALATLTLGDARLVIGSGESLSSSTDTFIFKGRDGNQLGDQVKHLVLNKTTGTANVTNGHLGVAETFLSTSGTLNAASTVTLLNRANGTYAQVLPSAGGSATLEVERFIPAKRAFRLLSPSVLSTATINAQWQEGASQYNQNPVPGFGTHITGFGTQNPDPVEANQNGFDWNPSGNASLFPYNNAAQGWVTSGVANTDAETFSYNTPLRLFVRGDRTTDLSSNEATPSTTILRTRGSLRIGNHSVTGLSADANHFNFVANPYASRVDFRDVTKTNITGFIYVWDASLGDRGAFATVDLGNNTPDPSGSNANAILMPGQAFFVRNTAAGNPSINFTETHKAIAENHTSIFSEEIYLNLGLRAVNNNQTIPLDGIGFRFNEAYNIEINDSDARKLGNPDENFLIIKDGSLLSIEKRPLPLEEETIALGFLGHQYENYQFVPQFTYDNSALKVYLKDNYLNTQTELSANEAINFQVDHTIPESTNAFRFELIFSPIILSSEDFQAVSFGLYPNPATTEVQISLPQLTSAESWDIEVYDINGKRVLRTNTFANETLHSIDVRSLNSGVYLIKVSNNQHTSTQKLIKK